MQGTDFSWYAVIPTVVGGGISVITTVVMFSINQWKERKKLAEEKRSSEALRAFVALQKLLKTANSIEGLARHLDRELKEAQDRGDNHAETSHLIRPIIGARVEISEVSVEESLFLARKDKGALLSEIWEIQQRAINNDHIVGAYNQLKDEYGAFLESCASQATDVRSEGASYSLHGNDALIATMKTGKMNSLIVPLIENLDDDRKQIRKIVESFLEEARAEFGSRFPGSKVEWIE